MIHKQTANILDSYQHKHMKMKSLIHKCWPSLNTCIPTTGFLFCRQGTRHSRPVRVRPVQHLGSTGEQLHATGTGLLPLVSSIPVLKIQVHHRQVPRPTELFFIPQISLCILLLNEPSDLTKSTEHSGSRNLAWKIYVSFNLFLAFVPHKSNHVLCLIISPYPCGTH